MPSSPPLARSRQTAARLVTLVGAAFAGCAAPGPSVAGEPDPMEILAASGETLYAGEAAQLLLTATVRVVEGEDVQESVADYRFARRGDAAFLFEPVFEEGEATDDGVVVRGDGELILTHILAVGRFTLEESSAGVAAFVQSPLSQGVGNPLGGLGLSLLHPVTTGEMVGRVTKAEYVGEEQLGEAPAHRCRYTVDDRLVFDVWFSVDAAPRARRLEADLSALMTSGDEEGVEYVVSFDYDELPGEPPAEAEFRLVEPEGAQLVESFFRRGDPAPHRLLGEAAPAFELAGLEGAAVSLADHLGKDVVVLDFWATWCPPCVAALPTLDRVTASFAEKGVVFYAVDQAESVDTVTAFLEAREISPPVLLDEESAAASAYDVEGLPTSVLIGRDGTVQVVHVGFSENLEEKLTAELESLVAGENLAEAELAAYREEQARRKEKLERLRAKLADAS